MNPPIEECCVLIPCNTLEDFPSSLTSEAATGLLGAWMAAWHPALIAAAGKIPTWCRADVPPRPLAGMYFLLPACSAPRLPSDFEESLRAIPEATLIRGDDRAAFLDGLPVSQLPGPSGPLTQGHRPVEPLDFFAVAYVFLQVQLMTRQLRYTSNLDEVVFADQVVKAAVAWSQGDATTAADTLHTAFDLLSQERDHYFSADPHLVDLVLLAGSTLGSALTETLLDERPINLLVDTAIARGLHTHDSQNLNTIQQRLAAGNLSLAGGGLDANECLDHQTAAQLGQAMTQAKQHFVDTFGRMPAAFARYSGGIPGDLAPWLAALGYQGVIPIDFAGGTGFRDESKLLWQTGSGELEALVCKPLNAADEASFLRLGPMLGSAVDCGDVATALLVRWPGQSCHTFEVLQRASQWGLALGKFWTLDDYFTQGERPYHSFQSDAIEANGHWLASAVGQGQTNPLTTVGGQLRSQLSIERDQLFAALTALVAGKAVEVAGVQVGGGAEPSSTAASHAAPTKSEATLLAAVANSQPAVTGQRVCLNPHPIPLRVMTSLEGYPPAVKPPIFSAHGIDGRSSYANVDVPAMGFAVVAPGTQPEKRGWFQKPQRRADGQTLSNEFLEVTIANDGSVTSVHSGSVRGNRFSLQLVHFDSTAEPRYCTMTADRIQVIRSSSAIGEIECVGRLVRGERAVADYQLRYCVRSGSRLLEIDGELNPMAGVKLGSDPWQNYFAARIAVASEAAQVQTLLRDKVHRLRGRRINSPLGLVIDEGERQTLVLAAGRPAHRYCGDRFVDTLLMVAGQSDGSFRLEYGFDVKSPIAFARSRLCPVSVLTQSEHSPAMPEGWLLQLESRSVLLTTAEAQQCDGSLQIEALLVETRGKTTKTRLHCFRDPQQAIRLGDGHAFEVEGDSVKIVLAPHETLRLRLRF